MPQPDAPAHTSNTASLSVSIVVHHSTLMHLRRTLFSLANSLADAMAVNSIAGAEVCVLDNSSDPTYGENVAKLIAQLPPVQAVSWIYRALTHNRGFGAAHNEAILSSKCEFHLVLNPDVELAREALALAIAAIRQYPSAVALNPQALGSDGEPQFLCKAYPSVLVLLLRAFGPSAVRARFERKMHAYELRGQLNRIGPVDVPLLSGCFMLLRGTAVRSAKGFDAGYFLYFEDFDLSLRLQRFGSLLYAPQVEIVHFGGEAARKGWRHKYWFIRSAIRFFGAHGWRWW